MRKTTQKKVVRVGPYRLRVLALYGEDLELRCELDFQGKPLAGRALALCSGTGRSYTQVTDGEGRARFQALPLHAAGGYRLSVEEPHLHLLKIKLPRFAGSRTEQGVLRLLHEGRTAVALDVLEKLKARMPEEIGVYTLLASVHADTGRRRKGLALLHQAFRLALKGGERLDELYYRRATHFQRAGRRTALLRALGDMEKSLALDPSHEERQANLMHILHRLGRDMDALKVYARFRARFPGPHHRAVVMAYFILRKTSSLVAGRLLRRAMAGLVTRESFLRLQEALEEADLKDEVSFLEAAVRMKFDD